MDKGYNIYGGSVHDFTFCEEQILSSGSIYIYIYIYHAQSGSSIKLHYGGRVYEFLSFCTFDVGSRRA
jgi:hypothetical protein